MPATYMSVAPASEPIDSTAFKTFHRITESGEDDLVDDVIIPAARQRIENLTGYIFLTQTWITKMDSWPNNRTIFLQKKPVESITHVKYLDTDGNLQTLDSSYYDTDLNSSRARIYLKEGYSWPDLYDGANTVIITFDVGNSDASTIEPDLLLALYMLGGFYYQNREAFTQSTMDFKQIPEGLMQIIGSYMIHGLQP